MKENEIWAGTCLNGDIDRIKLLFKDVEDDCWCVEHLNDNYEDSANKNITKEDLQDMFGTSYIDEQEIRECFELER